MISWSRVRMNRACSERSGARRKFPVTIIPNSSTDTTRKRQHHLHICCRALRSIYRKPLQVLSVVGSSRSANKGQRMRSHYFWRTTTKSLGKCFLASFTRSRAFDSVIIRCRSTPISQRSLIINGRINVLPWRNIRLEIIRKFRALSEKPLNTALKFLHIEGKSRRTSRERWSIISGKAGF